jgi:uncharacterized DUF497 family protein
VEPPWGNEPVFDWDIGNQNHIARHSISDFEVEECFDRRYTVQPHRDAAVDPKKFGNRYAVFGTTAGGRKLVVIIGYQGGCFIRTITAFDRK